MLREVLTVEGRAPHNASNLARNSNAIVARSKPKKKGARAIVRSPRLRLLKGDAVTEAGVKVQEAMCPRCEIETKVRHRPFSDQALSALLVWNEIKESAAGQPICDSCYDELREILIDRAEEINNPKPDKVETYRATEAASAPVASKGKATKAAEKPAEKTATAKKTEKPKPKEKEKTPARGKKVRKVS